MVLRTRVASLLVLALAASLAPARASAQVLDPADVPPELRGWIPWVLDGSPQYGCTMRDASTSDVEAQAPVCVWPGELVLTMRASEATFVLDATGDRRWPLALPGSGRAWPVDVRVDGRDAPVLVVSGRPTLWLDPGAHRIEGRIPWATPPETLAVPDDVARVSVVRDGVSTIATRGTGGEIWLRAGGADVVGEEQVALEVHRRLVDGSPIELETRIIVRAAGRARELRLPRVLPEGVIPVEVSAELPVRLLATGELTIQLRAGTYAVTIRALGASPETTFRRPDVPAPWPTQEVWVWAPDESFRQVEVEGASGIDPQRTSLPDEWRAHSAYLVDAETELVLHTLRRGEASPAPNQLGITREVWLDLDGAGYTARDQIHVEMHSGHRIELVEGELGRVSLDGQDQLVTVTGEGARPGVEIRGVGPTLSAEWRDERRPTTLPAVAWSENASSSSTTLHLPPGWLLLHAGSVDRAPGTWLDRWTLLALFALLLISAAVGRVYGAQWGVIALFGVGLAFHEDDAPQWLWLVLAGLAALHRALGTRSIARFARWLYVATAIVGVLMVVWFAGAQLKIALYPQLADRDDPYGGSGGYGGDVFDLSRGQPAAPGAITSEESAASYDLEQEGGSGRRHAASARDGFESNAYWLDPNAVVQTGFGVPTWSWSSYMLQFDGPVARDHRIELYLLPPWAFRLAALARAVLLLALLGIVLLRRPRASVPPAPPAAASPPHPPPTTTGGATTGAAAALRVALAISLAAAASTVSAQNVPPPQPIGGSPSPELLEQLRQRLERRDPCGDRCSEAHRMRIEVAGDVLRIDLSVSAASPVAYPLPGPSEAWVPSVVTLDGAASRALVRLDGGFLHARVPAGAHEIHLEGSLAGRDAITLAFGRAPRSLTIDATGWETDGLGSDDRVAESIQLRRTLERTETGEQARSDLPAWLEVRRRLIFGVRWTVETVVARRSPANAPTVARIPLLPGESVTDSSVVVENGAVLVTLGQRDGEVRWTSVLTPSESVALSAPAQGAISEVWTIACSPLWHCEPSGIAPTREGDGGSWEPIFHPWPGDTLTIAVTRPDPAEGQSLTVDRASLSVRPGVRLSASSLEVSVRSSVSAPFSIELPAGTEVRSLAVDGQTRPLQRDGDRVVVALQPGSHTIQLELQSSDEWSFLLSTPRITLGSAAVNVELHIDLSESRWVLWLDGPMWGPAVLFWPYLALVVVLALVLSRRREVPLRPYAWVLLMLGLTQVPAVAALIVVGWFFVIANRREDLDVHPLYFDARQLVIIGYTIVAFGCLVWAVESGLLGDPEMEIAGPDSYAQRVRFFVDRTDGTLPIARVISLPIWVYRLLMFAWALWLAFSLIRWVKWAWQSFREGGLFRPLSAPARAGASPLDASTGPGAATATTTTERATDDDEPPPGAPPPA
jgi:hypothetical protein